MLILLLTLGINIFVSIFEYKRQGVKQSDSYLGRAHTRSDIFVSTGVLLTPSGIKLGLPPLLIRLPLCLLPCLLSAQPMKYFATTAVF